MEVWHIFRSRDRTSWVIDSAVGGLVHRVSSFNCGTNDKIEQGKPKIFLSLFLTASLPQRWCAELHSAGRDDAVAARLIANVEAGQWSGVIKPPTPFQRAVILVYQGAYQTEPWQC